VEARLGGMIPGPLGHKRTMRARDYAAASVLSLTGVSAATYLVYPAVVAGAPHRWVVVLAAMSATAFVGAWMCDRWQTLRDLVVGVITFVGSLLASLFGQLATGPESPLERMQTRLAESKAQIEAAMAELRRLEEKIDAQEEKIKAQDEKIHEDAKRIAELECRIRKLETPRAREVTGAVLTGLGILLGFAATVLWAANLA
jgi:peptidoglycan hydrolase CwlO-like protein